MLIFTAYLFVQNKIVLEELIIIFSCVGQMIWANVNGASMINRFRGSLDIFDRMTQQAQWDSGSLPFSFEKSLRVENLGFSYGENQVIRNFSCEIKKGSKLLIYGPSGTGKTTLLNCLSQQLTSYSGQILYDDQELKTIDFESFYQECGYIRQEHFLFEDSIKNNIVLNQRFDKNKFVDILKSLDLYDWIMSLDNEEDTVLLNNGTNVSGGQRQRISIARELYRECNILFIDEPSASLDDETASKLYDTLFKLDQTIVLVSHRHLKYLGGGVDQIIQFDSEGVQHVL